MKDELIEHANDDDLEYEIKGDIFLLKSGYQHVAISMVGDNHITTAELYEAAKKSLRQIAGILQKRKVPKNV
jgi:hypothetical protein